MNDDIRSPHAISARTPRPKSSRAATATVRATALNRPGYAHMYGNGIHVRVGDHVIAGQHIADVGSDGKSTGPHLLFEIRLKGRSADPASWLSRSQDPRDVALPAGGCSTTVSGSTSAPEFHVLP